MVKAVGAYAFRREDSEESLVIDLLVGGSTVGVRVTRDDRQEFKGMSDGLRARRAQMLSASSLLDRG
jgi:hypothetical protein